LLRPLIAVLTLLSSACFADTPLPDASTHGPLIDKRLEEASALGEDLKSRLHLIEREFDLPENLATRALESLRNGRVREMLNIGPNDLPEQASESKRYPGGIFVFASFSMPKASLKAVLQDASHLGLPVVFNGFIDNSVTETEAQVRAIYDDESISHGFIIDPTLFARFNIRAVPTVVSTALDLDVCDTPACAGDGIPPHDRVAGNVPLTTLLEIIARGNAEHARPVQVLLEAQR
jgi:conjugal transfer pilus assembly protein TrbC